MRRIALSLTMIAWRLCRGYVPLCSSSLEGYALFGPRGRRADLRADSRSHLASSPTLGSKPIPSSRSVAWPRQVSRGALDEEGLTPKARAASPLPVPRSTASTIFLRKSSE
jgi:hypothetical protein